MASIHLEGILVDSVGEIDVGGVITFTHLTTTGGTIASTQTELIIPPDGAYSIDVEYGQIRIDYTTRYTENFIANVIVNSDSTATSIPELLSATTPVTEPIIIEMQGLVADAVTAEAGAVAAEAGAVVAEAAAVAAASSSLPLTGGTVEGDLTLVNSSFKLYNDVGNANPNFYKAQDATGGIGLGQNRARGTIAAPTALLDGDVVSGVSALGHDGTAYKNSGGFRFKVAGTVSLGVVPMKLVLETSETNGVTERLVVMPDGKIGIGTSAPAALLDVAGDVVTSGNVNFSGLPTSSAGLVSGDLWNNAGVLNII